MRVQPTFVRSSKKPKLNYLVLCNCIEESKELNYYNIYY